MSSPKSKSINGYSLGIILDETAYSKVFSATKEGESYAIKQKKLLNENGIIGSIVVEADILKRTNHPNLINCVDIFTDEKDQNIFFVFEKAYLDLNAYWKSKEKITPLMIIEFAFEMLCALNYLHKHRLIHGNLNPSNVLFLKGAILKLTNFSLSTRELQLKKQIKKDIQALSYEAPEILLGLDFYSSAIDIWSFGVILYQMIFEKLPFAKSGKKTDRI